jgi:hypothetical protein
MRRLLQRVLYGKFHKIKNTHYSVSKKRVRNEENGNLLRSHSNTYYNDGTYTVKIRDVFGKQIRITPIKYFLKERV